MANRTSGGQGRGRRPRLGYTGQAAVKANTAVQQTIADPKETTGKAWNTAAGFILGALGDVLLINYLKGGFPQVKQWLAAKFLNRLPGSTSTITPSPAPATGGGGGGGGARPQ